MRAVTVALISLQIAGLAGSAPLQAQHRPSSFLTFEEIDRARGYSDARTAYDIVQMLRPRWLEMRDPLPAMPSAALVNPPVVYVDDVSMGGADFLSTIPVEAVLEMRWLSSNEAAARLGTRDGVTAIIVTLIH